MDISNMGRKKILLLILISFFLTIALENISICTGFPYGVFKHYLPGIWIGKVPVVVGLVYFPFVSIGWVYGDLIVKNISANDTIKKGLQIILAMLVASSVEALYDPVGSLVLKQWEYPNGGGVFGVPMSNALGWILNIGVTLIIFEVITNKFGTAAEPRKNVFSFHIQNCILLAIQPIPLLICRFCVPYETIIDCTGKAWGLVELFDALGMFGLLLMGLLFVIGMIANNSVVPKKDRQIE